MNHHPPTAPRCPDCNRCVSRVRIHQCPSRAIECVRGHPWSETAQYTPDGRRHCRECRKLRYTPRRGRMNPLRCYRGHAKTAWNWYFTRDARGGHWRCRVCRNQRLAEYRRRAA